MTDIFSERLYGFSYFLRRRGGSVHRSGRAICPLIFSRARSRRDAFPPPPIPLLTETQPLFFRFSAWKFDIERYRRRRRRRSSIRKMKKKKDPLLSLSLFLPPSAPRSSYLARGSVFFFSRGWGDRSIESRWNFEEEEEVHEESREVLVADNAPSNNSKARRRRERERSAVSTRECKCGDVTGRARGCRT